METSHKHTFVWGYSRSISMVPWMVIIVLITVGIPIISGQHPSQGFSDLRGNYCRTRRPTQCCDGRYDQCSVPILGTLCYCDQFCDRTDNPDCCPDFWNVCKGITPSPEIYHACYKDGKYIPHTKSYKFNCNECTCTNGNLICDNDNCMIDEQVLVELERAPQQFGWRAANYSQFWGRKARDGLILKTGTLNPEALSLSMYPILLQPDRNRIPREFDAREKYEWRGRGINHVSDQGWCGASWAFSTLGVAQDRLSIESAGNETVRLSPQNLLSCDRRGQKGCEGGHVDRAWQYLRRIGVVREDCYEYESGSTGRVPECRIPRRANHFNLRCASNKQEAFQRKDLYKTEPAYRISGKEEDIQWEIMTSGPVQAMMKVHRDLFMYKSGVYANSGLTQETASHSVRILGWGEDGTIGYQPVKYWLVANSWGTDWGEGGLFRVKRGSNESDIETFIIAVRARLEIYNVRRSDNLRSRQSRNRRRRPSRRTNDFYHRQHGNKKV